MDADTDTAREALARAGQRLYRAGLNQGAEGNLSLRAGNGFVITPSGIPWETLTSGQMVVMNARNEAAGGKPSSEWLLHRAILDARPEIQAVVHTHSSFATTLACLRRDLPPFHYMIAMAGGPDIRCSRYATFGTPALAEAAVEALEGRRACLLANHGMIAAGESLDAAVTLALAVEKLCEQYWRACQLGEPILLTDEEMAEVMAKFADYGR
ncbi:class II aldolase [Thioalkalivibrio denitrificans]|uniref:Class II aldolase n=1 Tax=Thioalkalivibrio denitrificans TaxID=108003 RepID=A0A1V3NQ89_9GAMM|nr:class II aldolase/adducin family protein [Thioalkalivibrio denitrificans]OOG27123.1 class II aldolase [Thioalkalivibrio denitrificans]